MSKWSDTWRFKRGTHPRLHRHLAVHFGENNELLCMSSKSNTYLFPHLTTVKEDVTCEKCKELLNI